MATDQVRWADGSVDFSLGVDSSKVPTVKGDNNPNGLARNALAWCNNATVRGGGILQRTGWQPICTIHDSTGLYQGGWMYDQTNALPYLVVCVSGRFLQIRVDTDNSVNDITGPLVFPATEPLYHFVQGAEFMVVQAGDYTTPPAFWDGSTMWQSADLVGGELPPAGPMVYYQGRLWYAYYNSYTAGDIIGGASGTAPYGLRDSILKVTENPLAVGGDGFAVPTQAGNIRAMQYAANLDSALGEGTLYVFTRKQVYALDVPISRDAWVNASDNPGANGVPLQRVIQRTNGAVGDRSVIAVNGDLFYQSLEPGIRSLFTALRYFNQWGNTPISKNIDRALAFNDRALMRYSTGIEFDNRMLQGIIPEQTPQGAVHRAIASLDFFPISGLGDKPTPVWEGIYEGLDVLQLFKGDFGGRERAFAVVVSRVDSSIQLWELTNDQRRENGDERVSWYFELPSYTWDREFDLKKLDGGELWFDKIFGTVDIRVSYRVDSNPCWQLWHIQRVCSARSCAETIDNPVCYPEEPYRENSKFPIILPVPPNPACDDINERPMNVGHMFQVKIEVKGWCRYRGGIFYAIPVLKQPFGGLSCLPNTLVLPT